MSAVSFGYQVEITHDLRPIKIRTAVYAWQHAKVNDNDHALGAGHGHAALAA